MCRCVVSRLACRVDPLTSGNVRARQFSIDCCPFLRKNLQGKVTYRVIWGHAVAELVEALRNKPEGRG